MTPYMVIATRQYEIAIDLPDDPDFPTTFLTD